MNIVVVLGHPDTGSFNHAIAKTAVEALQRSGHSVILHDLYAEGFDPLLPAGEIPEGALLGAVIAQHCAEIATADGIVIVHPNWWGQPPAILKGWVDRVFRPGLAYRFLEGDSGEGVPLGLLKAKAALVFNTSNTSEVRELRAFGDPLETLWKNCIFRLCGVEEFYRKTFSTVVTSSAEQRATWLSEVRETVNQYFPAEDGRRQYPILEFDPAPEALIEPSRLIEPIDVPEHCVICFFQEVITKLCQAGQATLLSEPRSEAGIHPLYGLDVGGRRLAVFHPGVGAPLAAGLLEEVIALGCKKFVVCGGAGVLDKDVTVGRLVVPSSAIRDEGTSYHYLPPSREVAANPAGIAAVEQVLKAHQCDYLIAKTWTTDAFYRETPAKIQLRKAEGCLTVEMEAAALFAVAQFRGVVLAQILYGGDDVSGDKWDSRLWDERISVREKLFWLAAEACLSL
jgi:putative NADPH-quinone reductase/uridine phosphorylase